VIRAADDGRTQTIINHRSLASTVMSTIPVHLGFAPARLRKWVLLLVVLHVMR
jgi:hypothetical protein